MADPKNPLAFLTDRERLVQRFLLSEVLGPPRARSARARPPPPRPPKQLKEALAELEPYPPAPPKER